MIPARAVPSRNEVVSWRPAPKASPNESCLHTVPAASPTTLHADLCCKRASRTNLTCAASLTCATSQTCPVPLALRALNAPVLYDHAARPRAPHTRTPHLPLPRICTARPREVHPLLRRSSRRPWRARSTPSVSCVARSTPRTCRLSLSHRSYTSAFPGTLFILSELSPHIVCATGDSPPSDQVAHRLLRAKVRRRCNLAVVARSQVRRGHARRFSAVYLRVL